MLIHAIAAFGWNRNQAALKGAFRIGMATRRAFLFILLLLIAATIAPHQVAQAAPPNQSPEEGLATFQQKCIACHTVGEGDGDKVGPDLQGVTERRETGWLTRWISAPDQMLAEQDPIATELLQQYDNVAMPNLRLTESDVASIIAYLKSTVNVAAPTQSSQVPSAAKSGGDSVRGKNLFTGTKRLRNRGPSCRACHTAAGIGALEGGSLGPDLTGSYSKLGDALITWPRTVAPMAAIFSDKPLTPEEEADLLAFFEAASVAQRPSQAIWQLSGLALAGLVVFAVIAQLVWRRRLNKVREPMVAGQASRRS